MTEHAMRVMAAYPTLLTEHKRSNLLVQTNKILTCIIVSKLQWQLNKRIIAIQVIQRVTSAQDRRSSIVKTLFTTVSTA